MEHRDTRLWEGNGDIPILQAEKQVPGGGDSQPEWQSRTAAPGPSPRTGLDVPTGGTTCLVKMMSFELLQTWGDSGDSELETWLVGPGVAVMTGPGMRLDSLQSGLIAFCLSHPWGTVQSRQRTASHAQEARGRLTGGPLIGHFSMCPPGLGPLPGSLRTRRRLGSTIKSIYP